MAKAIFNFVLAILIVQQGRHRRLMVAGWQISVASI